MSEFGHLKISRKAYLPKAAGGDPFWNEDREFSRWEAWEYLLQAAAYADHKRVVSGRVVEIARGETPPLAVSFLATAWGWSSKRVRVFLNLLSEMDRIRAIAGASTGNVYLIMNYDYYQSSGAEKGEKEGETGAKAGPKQGESRATKRSSKAVKQESNTEGEADVPAPIDELREKRKARLPATWVPNEQHRAMAASVGVDIDNEVEKFRDHYAANGEARLDWDASFRKWLRNAAEYTARRPSVNGTSAIALDPELWK